MAGWYSGGVSGDPLWAIGLTAAIAALVFGGFLAFLALAVRRGSEYISDEYYRRRNPFPLILLLMVVLACAIGTAMNGGR